VLKKLHTLLLIIVLFICTVYSTDKVQASYVDKDMVAQYVTTYDDIQSSYYEYRYYNMFVIPTSAIGAGNFFYDISAESWSMGRWIIPQNIFDNIQSISSVNLKVYTNKINKTSGISLYSFGTKFYLGTNDVSGDVDYNTNYSAELSYSTLGNTAIVNNTWYTVNITSIFNAWFVSVKTTVC